MKLLTAKLSDEEHEALRGQADALGISMAALIKKWIAGEGYIRAHKTGQVDIGDMSTPTEVDLKVVSVGRVSAEERERIRRTLLAAPNDDCSKCGHDRHYYHMAGSCTCPTGPRTKCGCPVWIAPLDMIEPF